MDALHLYPAFVIFGRQEDIGVQDGKIWLDAGFFIKEMVKNVEGIPGKPLKYMDC